MVEPRHLPVRAQQRRRRRLRLVKVHGVARLAARGPDGILEPPSTPVAPLGAARFDSARLLRYLRHHVAIARELADASPEGGPRGQERRLHVERRHHLYRRAREAVALRVEALRGVTLGLSQIGRACIALERLVRQERSLLVLERLVLAFYESTARKDGCRARTRQGAASPSQGRGAVPH